MELTISGFDHFIGVIRGFCPVIRLDVHGAKQKLAEDSHPRVVMQGNDSRPRQAEDTNLQSVISNHGGLKDSEFV